MLSLDDTIAAISTPIGQGGIGIVRMTGPNAPHALRALFVPAGKSPSSHLEPRALHYGHIIDPVLGDVVDEVLVVHMPAPRTYTRQDVVEINGHGGIVALRRILDLCLRQGVRSAEAGEFTARAFLNGRLDLAQAEAVLDVVEAKTEISLQAAVGQLSGQLSEHVRTVRSSLVSILAYLEARIDFEEDEIPHQDVGPELEQAKSALEGLLTDADRGIIVRQGIRVAIVGRPNVGKSSLLNQLLRTSRAIVTEIPGTTRDTLEETLNLQGIPVVLVDTAGIVEQTEDPIERLGIERSRAALAQAEMALLVVDASQPLTDADRAIAAQVQDKPALVVLNKVDLLQASPGKGASQHEACCALPQATCVPISALTGQGLELLEEAVVQMVWSGQVIASEVPLVTSARHKEALSRALDHVVAARAAHRAGAWSDLIAIDVAAAVNALGQITGQTASEELIETIFANFCVGK